MRILRKIIHPSSVFYTGFNVGFGVTSLFWFVMTNQYQDKRDKLYKDYIDILEKRLHN